MHLIPRWPAALCLLFLAALWIAACDKDGITEPDAPNRTPVTSGAIPAQTLEADGTVTLDLSSWFNDPDGDRLTYSAQSSDPGIATVSVSGNTLTIQAAAQKTGKHAPATIPAEAPRAPDVSPHRSPDRFDPEHEGDTGALEALYKERAASAEATGPAWTAAAATDETVTITVTARDPDGLSASQTFDVTVETAEAENQGPVAVGTIPAQAVETGHTVDVDAKPWFSDPDDDMLSYEAASQNVAVATVAAAGNVVTVTGIAEGDTQIDITARDPAGLSATNLRRHGLRSHTGKSGACGRGNDTRPGGRSRPHRRCGRQALVQRPGRRHALLRSRLEKRRRGDRRRSGQRRDGNRNRGRRYANRHHRPRPGWIVRQTNLRRHGLRSHTGKSGARGRGNDTDPGGRSRAHRRCGRQALVQRPGRRHALLRSRLEKRRRGDRRRSGQRRDGNRESRKAIRK